MISENDKELAVMQRKQLEILKELDRVCGLLNVRYFLASGTCLGALRHQGFIPWDDDIDVYMFWDDVDVLVAHQDLFQDWCFVQTRETDRQVKTTHCRIRDSRTCMLMEDEVGLDINHGVFIDVYILYPYPDDALTARKLILDSFVYRVLAANEGPKNHGTLARTLGNAMVMLYGAARREKKIAAIEKAYRTNGGKNGVATYFGRDISLVSSIVYPRAWFDSPVRLAFEDMVVNCPGDPEEYCRLQYGDDFMTLPPEEKRVPHHDYLYCSVNESYGEYAKRQANEQGLVEAGRK